MCTGRVIDPVSDGWSVETWPFHTCGTSKYQYLAGFTPRWSLFFLECFITFLLDTNLIILLLTVEMAKEVSLVLIFLCLISQTLPNITHIYVFWEKIFNPPCGFCGLGEVGRGFSSLVFPSSALLAVFRRVWCLWVPKASFIFIPHSVHLTNKKSPLRLHLLFHFQYLVLVSHPLCYYCLFILLELVDCFCDIVYLSL